MTAARKGGCACGTVRYEVSSEPFDAGWCHCRKCQLSSGAPALVFATVLLDDFRIVTGEGAIGSVRLVPFGRRRFCSACGTPLTMQVDHQPDTIDFTVATLDDPTSVAPGFHIFTQHEIGWSRVADDLPRHRGSRPRTRASGG